MQANDSRLAAIGWSTRQHKRGGKQSCTTTRAGKEERQERGKSIGETSGANKSLTHTQTQAHRNTCAQAHRHTGIQTHRQRHMVLAGPLVGR